jgi:hypothetical protein
LNKKIYLLLLLIQFSSIILIKPFSIGIHSIEELGETTAFSLTPDDSTWHIHDEITPSVDKIIWIEEGEYPQPLERISEGRWFYLICRFQLRDSEIFASFVEAFNWTLVSNDLESEGRYYSSFDEFRDEVSNDPSWWLSYSWHIDSEWFGIQSDRAIVLIDFNEETSKAVSRIWCYITNIPSFFIRSFRGYNRRLEPLFEGFSFNNIYIGSFETLEWYESYTAEYIRYKVYLKVLANLLSSYESNYSFNIESREEHVCASERELKIVMPSDTQVQSISPSNIASYEENTAVFTLHEGQTYPNAFSVTSGPPVKDFSEIFLENITYWVTDPSYWAVFGSLIAVVYGAYSGRRIWSQRRTYYRLYRSMVSIYDRYSKDYLKFYEEIEKLTASITQYFIENRINDDQFDRLLSRRDDLLERVGKIQKK